MSVVLLPAVAVGSAVQGVIALAPDLIPGQPVVEYLADKTLAYWFLALAAIAITSWTWAFKWLIGQLSSQRETSAETQRQLIEYMRADHAATATALAQANSLHLQLLTRLNAEATVRREQPGV